MAHSASPPKPFVVRARRETVALVVTASAVTFALSYAVHSHPTPPAEAPSPVVADQQTWTGELAQLAPDSVRPGDGEPLTSASLVVPKSQLALPVTAVRPLVKLRGCDNSVCTPKPPRRPNDIANARTSTTRTPRQSLMARLNPLKHLPDMSTISRPFAYAGDTISGWMRRF